MKHFLLSCVLALTLIGVAHPATAYELPKARLIAVYFYADWCPNCKLLSPQLDKARKDGALDAKDILFVKLDLTDANTIHQSIMLAEGLGIAPYMQKQGSSTGYVAVLSADTKTELARYDRTSTAAGISAGITKALDASTSAPAVKP